ncbi:MAG: hypothetical protein QOF84_4173 [Streptomyces sp.]|nr:hypothetical protein [Streptomyces sp.]
MPAALTELPWNVQLVGDPPPKRLVAKRVDVVQAGMPVGLRALEAVRGTPHPVGPVLYCVTHLLVHIPVERDTAHRWHAPQTLCRPDTFACSLPGLGWSRHECRRIWLMPHDSAYAATDSRGLHHQVALARSASRKSTVTRPWEASDGR